MFGLRLQHCPTVPIEIEMDGFGIGDEIKIGNGDGLGDGLGNGVGVAAKQPEFTLQPAAHLVSFWRTT